MSSATNNAVVHEDRSCGWLSGWNHRLDPRCLRLLPGGFLPHRYRPRIPQARYHGFAGHRRDPGIPAIGRIRFRIAGGPVRTANAHDLEPGAVCAGATALGTGSQFWSVSGFAGHVRYDHGQQWGVGASLAMEKAPMRLRGLFSGMLQQGYAAGYLLAAFFYWLMFPRVGWRPLFFVACLPALAARHMWR
jgi:MFS family permease